MTKFNKGILASAIAASAMLAGAASAAELGYSAQQQITYAKDLFATDSRTIDLPANYTVSANSTSEINAISGPLTATNGVDIGNIIEVVVSLGQGTNAGKFQSAAANMNEAALRTTVLVGEQLGGAAGGTAIGATATVTYSQGERELRIRFTAPAAGTTPANSFAVRFPSLRLYDLQGALLDSSALNGGVSITNITKNQSILAGNALFAKSKWGEKVTVTALAPNKWIDVQRCSATVAPRTRFSNVNAEPAPTVGTSCSNAAAGTWFNAGSVAVQIDSDNTVGLTGVPGPLAVSNFSSPTPWSLSSTKITYTINGTNLSGFGGGNLWLDTNANCTKAADQFLNLSVATDGKTAVASHTMGSSAGVGAVFAPLTNSITPVTFHVCAKATGQALVAQSLSADVEFDHGVPALFVNPEKSSGAVQALRDNVGIFIFQNVNPAGTPSAQSFLRLTNNTAQTCAVTIDAKDDAGKLSGQVKYTLAAHASEQFNSSVLETGVDNQGRAITGKFGDGTGKWYVRVQPECANFTASALNRNSTDGTVTDLTPQTGNAWLNPTELLNP